MIKTLEKIIRKEIREDIEFGVFISERMEFGHYSTNAAFKLAPAVKKSPFEVAKDLAGKLGSPSTGSGAIFSKVEAVQPGFINIWLKPEIFHKNLKEILKSKNNYGKGDYFKGKKIMIEFTDLNPFKEFHIGHLMSNSIGEAISRIFEWNGAVVLRANYHGDIGLHVAKAVWGLLRAKAEKISTKEMAIAYALGAKAYESDEKAKEQINFINKEIYNKSNKEVDKIYKTGRKLSLEYFERIYKKLGTKFDYYFFESETGGIGKKIVEENIGEIFEKSDGAVVFKGEKYGLHTRVFINSEGLPTYEAKEIGLFEMKVKEVACDKYLSITGNEINDYFKVLMRVIEMLFPKFIGKIAHLSHGMLRLPSGKMSSRTGDVITAESLINEVEKLIGEKMKDRELDSKDKSEIEEIVAIGALKYSILKQAIGGDIIFDFDKSVSFEGDSGPYLQYAYTRAKSALENANSQKIKASVKIPAENITEVEVLLERFSGVVGRAGKETAPHHIVSYSVELARAFNSYYAKNRIVDADDEYSPYKVALAQAVSIVIKNGLEILGIGAPREM